MGCMARARFTPQHTTTQLIAFRNAVKTGPVSLQGRPQTQLNAFRNAVKTGPVSERGRPQSELNAFRNAVKSAAESFHSGNHTQAVLPESAVSFQSRPAVSRVGRFWNESAAFFQSRPAVFRVGQRRLFFPLGLPCSAPRVRRGRPLSSSVRRLDNVTTSSIPLPVCEHPTSHAP